MAVDLREAGAAFKFDEKKLLETYDILDRSYRERRGLYSIPGSESFSVPLPRSIERGSPEHANYLFFATIPDVFVVAENMFDEFKKLCDERPDFIDPKKVYEANRGRLEVVTKTSEKSKRTVKRLVPSDLDSLYVENIPSVGLHQQASLSHYKTARKIAKWYDGNAANVLKDVKDPSVAYRRLDIGRSYEPMGDLQKDRSFAKFGGLGRKTGTLLVMWLKDAGFVKDMDETAMLSPLDTHCYNMLIGRGIISVDKPVRVEKATRSVQALLQDAFKRNGKSARDFHYYQWDLGHNLCFSGSCDTKLGDEKLCSMPDVCEKNLDTSKYRKGFIAAKKNGK